MQTLTHPIPSKPHIVEISKPNLCNACTHGNHGEPDGPLTVCNCPCHEDKHVARFMTKADRQGKQLQASKDKIISENVTKDIDNRRKRSKVKKVEEIEKKVEVAGVGNRNQTPEPITPVTGQSEKGSAVGLKGWLESGALKIVPDAGYNENSGKIYLTKEKDNKIMSLLIIGRNMLPVSPRGKVGTLSVSVRENGQIGFSNSAGKVFENFTATVIGWDQESRTMAFTPVNLDKLPKGVTKEACFPVGLSEKIGTRYISAASLFKLDAIGYDFKSAGTHSFEAKIEKGTLSFTLPTEMAPKPKVAKKAKATAAAPAAAPAGEVALQEA